MNENVHFSSQNKSGECSGVLIGNKNSPSGGLIILHDWWGLTKTFQEVAARISDETGLVTLLPDLYRGKIAENIKTAEYYKECLDWDGTLADVRGAAEFLRSKGCTKVGVVGKCMGGALALAAAVKLDDVISAAVAFYGIPDQIKYNCKEIPIPIQLHFAVHDKMGFSSKKDYEALKDGLVEAGVNMEFYEYDADHAFTNPTQTNYLPGAFYLSFYRCCEFLREVLG